MPSVTAPPSLLMRTLMVVAVIGVLAKRQLGANTGVRLPAASQAGGSIGGGAVMQQSQQLPQQIKQSIDATMQQARPEPDDK